MARRRRKGATRAYDDEASPLDDEVPAGSFLELSDPLLELEPSEDHLSEPADVVALLFSAEDGDVDVREPRLSVL